MSTNNRFHKVQINATIDKDTDDNIIKKGLMINIRSNSIQEATQLYRQLQAQLNGNGKEKTAPTCECGKPMVIRQGQNGRFYGCSNYPQCRHTQELNPASEEEPVYT